MNSIDKILDNLRNESKVHITQTNKIDSSIPNVKCVNGLAFNGNPQYLIDDAVLIASINNKLGISNGQLNITMDELIIACQEKYPYKFI